MNYTYDPNVDYSALMQQALADGNTQLAAIYEQQRNAKIRGENLSGQYETTSNYAQYLPYQEPTDAYAGLQKTQEEIAKIGQGVFSYDQKNDQSYQAYRKQALREADRATRDTMGAYAGMTQGVPSTAAITAASQAGDYYRAQLADKVPEFEANAYNRWLNEKNAAYQQQQLMQNGYAQLMAAENQQWQQQYQMDNMQWQQQYQMDNMQWQKMLSDREHALSLLSAGVMPSEQQLSAAGLTAQQAQQILAAQTTKNSGSSGGGSGSGSSGGGSGGKIVDWDTRQRLGEAFKTGGLSAVEAEMVYLGNVGYNVEELYQWIYTYYPYEPEGGYAGNPTGTPKPVYDDRYVAP